MRALVYEGANRIALQEAAEPEPRPGEVVVEVRACGICGSDVHAFLGHDERRPPPLILGHEVAGTIASDGRRVVVNPLVTCMACDMCLSGRTNLCPDRQIISMPPRPGGFAERVAIPSANALDVPDDFPLETAALAEPLACGWHAVRLAGQASARPLPSCRAAVLGGGAIGLAAALSLQAFGTAEAWIAEPNERRHDALAAAGPFRVYVPGDGGGPAAGSADIVVDAFGGEASRRDASALVAPGGVIVHIGLAAPRGGLDIRRMTLQEVTVIGTYTYTVADFRDTLAAMITGRLGRLDWTELRPLEAGPEAFAACVAGRVESPKILLTPHH